MNKMLVVFAVLALAGCAPSYGAKIDDAKVASFQTGKTTYQEVTSALGQPSTIESKSTGEKKAVYMRMEASARGASFIPVVGPLVGGVDTMSHSVVFEFDAQGVLISYSSVDSKACSGVGVYSDVKAENCKN